MSETVIVAKDQAIRVGYGTEPGTPEYGQSGYMQDQRRCAARDGRRNG
jgi:hypothetical protein